MPGKTRDGIKLSTIVRLASQLASINIREGTKHPYILQYAGLRPCPVAESSDARRMIAPWLRQATGYDIQSIYASFKAGEWYNETVA